MALEGSNGRGPGPAPILFVGGTGRSGTHVVAKLAGRNANYRLVPVECRFHVDADGYPGLLAGEVTKEAFIRRMHRFWWKGFQTDRMRGLYRVVPRERFEQALSRFDESFDQDRQGACRRLFCDLLWPLVEEDRHGTAEGLIEQSCDTIAQAPTLLPLFDEASVVHIVRDRRD